MLSNLCMQAKYERPQHVEPLVGQPWQRANLFTERDHRFGQFAADNRVHFGGDAARLELLASESPERAGSEQHA